MDAVARDLLDWYAAHARSLPWRDAPGPYQTLVSELMLQQTRVETVLPYFARFMERFPTVESLAQAPLDDLLTLWSGLGYYSRARNLHAAAREVVRLGGFPRSAEGLRALPGVGPYTAGAVASIAMGLDEVAVDGNLERVLSRLHRYEGPRQGIDALARRHLPAGRAGDYNQALMDVGARICAPRNPACDRCPLAPHCEARAAGDVERYPQKVAKKASPSREAVAGVWRRDGQVLLARRPDGGLLGGLYELPGADLNEGERPEIGLTRAFSERLGLLCRPGRALGQVQHVFTHLRLTLHVVELEAWGEPSSAHYTALRWADPAAPEGLGLSTLARKALALASEPPRQAPLFSR